MNKLCAENCVLFERGCKVGDPRNICGAVTTGLFCRHYSCTNGRQEGKRLWGRVQNGQDIQLVELHQVMGKPMELIPLNTIQKHGNGEDYQRFIDVVEADVFSRGLDGEIYFTGVNCFLTNDIK